MSLQLDERPDVVAKYFVRVVGKNCFNMVFTAGIFNMPSDFNCMPSDTFNVMVWIRRHPIRMSNYVCIGNYNYQTRTVFRLLLLNSIYKYLFHTFADDSLSRCEFCWLYV